MPFRLFSHKLVLSLLLISAFCIAFGIQISRTESTHSLNRPSHFEDKQIKHTSRLLPTRAIDWNQPVNVTSLDKNLSFPLSFSSNDEFLLIINNLNQSPQQSKTVLLSTTLNTNNQATFNCCFENTKLLRHAPPLHKPPSSAQHAESNVVRKSNRQRDTKREPAEKERPFYLFVTDGSLSDKNQYTRITGKLIQQSPRIAIYLDDQQRVEELAKGLVSEIIEKLEHIVLDKISNQCGPIRDVDQSGRFTVLLSPWLSKLQGGKTSINGFVRPSDFRKTIPEPFSNHCDMLYLNSTIRPGQELLDLLCHEVTHAAVSSIRTEKPSSSAVALMNEEDWLNEGIAHIMEPGYTNRDYRISEFYRSPESYPLIVPDYYREQLWRNHGCRGAVNLFLEWCSQIGSEQNFPYRFTHHRLTGVEKIEQIMSTPFSELFRQWSLHLAKQSLNKTPHGKSILNPSTFHCGKFLSTGPALRTWNLSHQSEISFNISASASGFLHLKPDSNQADCDRPQTVRINVNGFPNLQLTLLKIPENKKPLSLTARYSNFNQSKQKTKFAEVQLTCIHPVHSEVESLSLEMSNAYLSRAERQPRHFQTRILKSVPEINTGSLEVVYSGTQLENEMQITDFLIRIPQYDFKKYSKPVCLNFKTIVSTDQQQWMAAQCGLELPLKPAKRLAETSTPTATR